MPTLNDNPRFNLGLRDTLRIIWPYVKRNFMNQAQGLRLGLMPLGEVIGATLPKNSSMPVILIFAFLLGAGATFAEPAIAVLKAAGSGVKANGAPFYTLCSMIFPGNW
ncbi:MAG: hypothetical protein ACI9ON_001870 [Limisphaerales bacterium]|jgi:hypothetical protein